MKDAPISLSPLQKAAVTIKSLRARAEAAERSLSAPIAVVGMACRLPAQGRSPEALWEALRTGRSGSVEVPPDRWDVSEFYDPTPGVPGKMYVSKACFIDGVDQFDPLFFRISPREAVGIDPQQRLLLEIVHEALEDAGLPPFGLAGTRTGVFLGISTNDYSALLSRSAHGSSSNAGAGAGNAASVASGRISYTFGFQGPCFAVDTACSSSLVSAHLAVQSLRNRESDTALVAGVNLMLTPDVSINFCQGRMLSPDGLCKSFDAGADGYVRGEGCGVLVLKRLDDAIADDDRVLAVIAGSALNQDGKSAGLTAPNGTAQVAVIRDALKNAGLDRDDIDFIEAHGTGTALGDPIEMHALRHVFEGRDRPLNVGSVKATIGHAEAAAGVSGLIKAVLMLRNQAMPPHPSFSRLNPHIDLDDFAVDIALDHTPGTLHHIGVSSFGFSGTNAHVILSAAPQSAPPVTEASGDASELLISAQSAEALAELRDRYVDLLQGGTAAFADVCHSAQRERSRHKWWLTATDLDSLRRAIPSDDTAPSLPPQQGRRVPLPKTPFDRKRYWIDTTPPAPVIAATSTTGHPLLGREITLPFATETRFETRLSLSDPRQAFLADHQVQGRIVVPGAAILDMAAEARPGQMLRDIRFLAPIVIEADAALDVQLVCDETGGFRIVSFTPGDPGTAKLHASGQYGDDADDAADLILADASETVDSGAFYGAMADYGIVYGDTFKLLADIRRGRDRATARLEHGAGNRTPVLDAAMQLVAVALHTPSDGVLVPSGIGAVRIARMPGDDATVGVVARRDGAGVLADVVVSDGAGTAIRLDGVVFAPMAGKRAHGFHRLQWRGVPPLTDVLPPAAFPKARELAAVLAQAGADIAAGDAASDYDAAETALNGLATGYAIAALQRLGMVLEPGQEGGIGALSESLGIADTQRRLFGHILGFLAEDGIIERTGRRWCVLAPPDPQPLDADALARKYPAMSGEIAVLARCGAALDEVLTGRTSPLSLLFPKDGAGAGSFYQGSGYAETVNGMVGRIASKLAAALPPARHLRVVEIGAGTGATTHAMLDGLGARLGHYSFTDISPAFLASANRDFADPRIDTRRLDIETDPATQGFPNDGADIVVAANVLHATTDIAQSLAHARQLLAPGGMLVLVESTQARRWVDLVFGLTEGWWRFTDHDLRPDHPLMSRDGWQAALQNAGFEPGLAEGLDVIVARKPVADMAPDRSLSVSGDASGLTARLEKLGIRPVPASGNAKQHIHVVPKAEASEAGQIALFTGLCALVSDLAKHPAPPSLTLIGDTGLGHGGLGGFTRSLRLEHPEMQPRLLTSDGDAGDLVDEALSESPEDEIRYQGGARHVSRLVPVDDASPGPIRGTWLIAGGTGGLGQAIAAYLADHGAEKLVLVGRKTPKDLPNPGVPVEIATGDIADTAFLRRTVAASGPLSGVIHAAGSLSNAPINAQTEATAGRVIHGKIAGALALDAVTRDLDLDHFVLFSSAAGILGAARQANHAFAASFLDRLAARRRADGLPGLSLDWGIWREIGSAARLGFDAQAEELGLGSIAPAAGVAAFGAALGLGDPRILIVPGADFNTFTRHFGATVPPIYADLTAASAPPPTGPQRAAVQPKIAKPEAGPDLAVRLSAIVADILQIEGTVDTRVPLYDYGLDSLVAVEIKNRAEKDLGLSLQISDLIEGASIDMLAGAPEPAAGEPAEVQLHAIIGEILHLDTPLDPRTPLFEYGLDSLVAVEIRNRVEKDLGVTLQVRDLIEGASAADLLRLVAREPAVRDGARRIAPQTEDRHLPFPLTDIQQAYLLGRRTDVSLGGIGCYLYTEYDTQSLDFGRLEEAWNRLIARHDMLRLVINDDGTQQILPHVPRYTFEALDLSDLDDAAAADALAQQRDTLSARVVDPGTWPLFDIRVTRHAGGTRLHLGFDLIALDAASIHALRREWALLYENPDQVLPEIGLSFRDVVLEEREFRKSDAYHAAQEYWAPRAKLLPNPPDLPMADRNLETAPRFKRHRIVLPKDQADRLKAQCRAHKMTLAGVLASAYADTLAAFARDPHFSLTVTSFNRPDVHPDIANVLGDFTSTLLLEVDAKADRFSDRARALTDQMARDLDHSAVSGVEVLRERARRQPDALRSVPVVFTSALGFRDRSTAQSELAGWDRMGKTVYNVSSTPQVWIDHQISEEDGQLFCNWDVLQGIFPPGVIEAMTAAHENLLLGLAQGAAWDWPLRRPQPDMPRSTLVPLSDPETIHARFRDWASRMPDAVALITPERQLTYGELDRAASTIAHRLLDVFGSPEAARDRLVAITRPKSWEQVAEVLGVVMAGAAYVPLDPAWPVDRRRQIIEDSNAIELDPTWVMASPPDTTAGLAGFDDTDRLAYVIYTSGSTGAPKGVMIEHRAAHATIAEMNRRWNMGQGDRVLGVSALSFDLSVYDIFGPLSAGGTLVLPQANAHADPALWADTIDAAGITVWNSAPALMALLLDHGLPANHDLRLVLLSGDWIPLDTARRLKTAAAEARIVALGGATEAAIWSNFHEIGDLDADWRSIPYGTPLDGQMLHVVGRDNAGLPDWTTGEIEISGAGLARGYLGDQARTKARFRIDPVSGERRYRTGDTGRFRPYGTASGGPRPIEFLGREDFQVKILGHRIELGEIETVLERHPAVARAVAKTVDLHSHEKALAAFVVQAAPPVNLPFDAAVTAATAIEGASIREADFDANAAFLTQQTAIAVARACEVLTGTKTIPDADTLINDHGVAPRYRHWLRRTLPLAREVGDTTNVPVIRDLPTAGHFGFGDGELDLLDQVIADLPALLTERKNTADIYLSAETPEVYGHLFEQPNRAIAAALAALASNGPISVLEVGGGLGTTLAALNETLETSPIQYHYTDVSPALLNIARARVGERPGLRFGLLDMNAEPDAATETYDVIVATSTLHVARDIARTLRALRRRLKPGGVLLMLEETRFFPWYDLNMGLQADFDGRTDLALRPDHPILSRDIWRTQLAEAKFSTVEIPVVKDGLNDRLGFDVFLCRTHGAEPATSDTLRDWTAKHLPGYMVPRRIEMIDRVPLSANGKVDRNALHLSEQDASWSDAASGTVLDALLDLVRTSLGLTEITPDQSLFDAGASSISMLALQRQIGDRFGRRLSLQAMFEAPTSAAIARQIEGHDAPTSGLIRFAAHAATDRASRPRLIMMPGIFALPFYLGDLAERLAPDIDLVSVQLPGLYGDEQPLDTIEAQADYVLQRISKEQPEGPYYLGGHSYGGTVAFEVARRLRAKGADVPVVLLGDTVRTRTGLEAFQRDDVAGLAMLRGLRALYAEHLEDPDTEPDDPTVAFRQMVEHLAGKGILGPAALPFDQFVAMFKANFRALGAYRPAPLSGDLTLLRTDGGFPEEFGDHEPAETLDDPTLGWSDVVAGQVSVRKIPGNHMTLMTPDTLGPTADHIRAAILATTG